MPAARNHLPAGVLINHHEGRVSLPHPYTMRCLLGQLVDVRDDLGNRFLLAETDSHWVLHRRVTPDADGHARNHTEMGPPALAFARDGQ